MTKADIIEAVYERVGGVSKKEAAEIVEAVFNCVKNTLARGEKIKISGFGNFIVRDKKARLGRNPQTGQEITISGPQIDMRSHATTLAVLVRRWLNWIERRSTEPKGGFVTNDHTRSYGRLKRGRTKIQQFDPICTTFRKM